MTKLYPLKFRPILKERVWGGKRLSKMYNIEPKSESLYGESWELSGLEGDESLVSNGFLEGNDINDLVDTYLGDLVGDAVYDYYGSIFPLLIKILEVNQPLSLQIHPDDQTALERHDSFGKSECWYILEAEPTARIYLGLKEELTASEFYKKCHDGTIEESLNVITPKRGDLINIPPGTLHSAKGGILIAEIQQPSDITYRVYDWGREFDAKTAREMHLDLAIDCIDYSPLYPESLLSLDGNCNTPYFSIRIFDISEPVDKSTEPTEGFSLFMLINGSAYIQYQNGTEVLSKGSPILIPASLGEYSVVGRGKIMEVVVKGAPDSEVE